MKYISIDIETTGLDPATCQILSFGAIIEDTNNQQSYNDSFKFYYEFHYDSIFGSPMAMAMNASLIKKMADRKIPKEGIIMDHLHGHSFTDGVLDRRVVLERYEGVPADFCQLFLNWASAHIDGKLNFAGKNIGVFDLQFLARLPGWGNVKYRHRFLDPGVLFVDFKNDTEVPDLATCKARADMPFFVHHTALDDAWDVILLLRKHYENG